MTKCYYCANQRGGCPECNQVDSDFVVQGEVVGYFDPKFSFEETHFGSWEVDEDTVCSPWSHFENTITYTAEEIERSNKLMEVCHRIGLHHAKLREQWLLESLKNALI